VQAEARAMSHAIGMAFQWHRDGARIGIGHNRACLSAVADVEFLAHSVGVVNHCHRKRKPLSSQAPRYRQWESLSPVMEAGGQFISLSRPCPRDLPESAAGSACPQ